MKLSVLQENLNKGLAIATRAVANRPQLPVLTHVLLTTDQGRLKISSTDLETGVNLWVGAKIEKEGSISIPAKILSEFISSLPAGKVNFEVKENHLKLISGRFEARFNGLAASEFPKIPSIKGKPTLAIDSGLFTKAVSQVAFAAASDEGRPVLTGIYLFFENNQLSLVATDGYRLSLKTLKKASQLNSKSQLDKGLIVPAKAFQEAARVASEETKEVKLYLTADSNQLIFLIGDTEIITRLIEGEFPEFKKIIPSGGKIEAVIETDEFSQLVKVASIFARESANIIRFKVEKSGVEVSANTAQVGENKSSLAVKVKGGEGQIAFNSRYLLDFLNAVDSETFHFRMEESLNPGVFRAEKDDSFLHIIMPVRVQE